MKAMVLAAGQGTRLSPLTDQMPKPMIPVAGRPILEHNLRLLAKHGIREVVINLHHQPEVVTDYFGDGSTWGVAITYSREAELLGTAGAVARVSEFFDGPFLVLYGDNLTTCDLTRLRDFHQAKGGVGTIALFHREDPTSSGIVGLDADDRVVRFLEKPAPYQIFSHWVSAGLLVLEPDVLKYIPKEGPCDFGKDILPVLVKAGHSLYGYRMTEGLWWIDTNYDYQRVQALSQRGELAIP